MDKVFETNFSYHVKQGTTGKGQFPFSTDKIFILGGRLGAKL